MAHECPECYMLCHCNGDIDDIQFEGTKEQLYCRHCNPNSEIGDEDIDDIFFDDNEEEFFREEDNGPTGHGDTCMSDADPGL